MGCFPDAASRRSTRRSMRPIRYFIPWKLDALGPTYDKALSAVAPILQNRKLPEAHNDIQVKGRELRFEGPLKTAATAVEVFLLEYEEGLPAQQVGWGGAATFENLAVLLPAHNIYSDLLRQDPY